MRYSSQVRTQEALALLKILALGTQEVADGKMTSAVEVAARLRAKRPARR